MRQFCYKLLYYLPPSPGTKEGHGIYKTTHHGPYQGSLANKDSPKHLIFLISRILTRFKGGVTKVFDLETILLAIAVVAVARALLRLNLPWALLAKELLITEAAAITLVLSEAINMPWIQHMSIRYTMPEELSFLFVRWKKVIGHSVDLLTNKPKELQDVLNIYFWYYPRY
jgi:hypothetical protein